MRGLKQDVLKVLFLLGMGLQVMIDCIYFHVPNNITPVIMCAAIFGVWWAIDRPGKRKRPRKPVRMYKLN